MNTKPRGRGEEAEDGTMHDEASRSSKRQKLDPATGRRHAPSADLQPPSADAAGDGGMVDNDDMLGGAGLKRKIPSSPAVGVPSSGLRPPPISLPDGSHTTGSRAPIQLQMIVRADRENQLSRLMARKVAVDAEIKHIQSGLPYRDFKGSELEVEAYKRLTLDKERQRAAELQAYSRQQAAAAAYQQQQQSTNSVSNPVAVKVEQPPATLPPPPRLPAGSSSYSSASHASTAPPSLEYEEHKSGDPLQALEELLQVREQLKTEIEKLERSSGRKLTKGTEPPRNKSHWDYLLEEADWMARDFASERKWKMEMAAKLAKAVQRHFEASRSTASRTVKVAQLSKKRLSAIIARKVRMFWQDIQKVAKFKGDKQLEAKRKVALDLKLNHLVAKTEKLSEKVAKELAGHMDGDGDGDGGQASSSKSKKGSKKGKKKADDDDEEDEEEDEDEEDDMDVDSSAEPESKESSDAKLQSATAAAAAAQPTGLTLATSSVKTKIPHLIRHGSLREYQHIGLDWLVTLTENNLNGILADEMGLGKTVMTISLLAHLACEKNDWGPHLIVVPTSVIVNWEVEFKRWLPGFKVLSYYGGQKERKAKRYGWNKPDSFNVCITSYQLVLQDQATFKRKRWKFMILDEAHNIKNFKSQRWQTLLSFRTEHRLLLTGTPLQNNLMELWSLMHFLMPDIFQSQVEFKEWFNTSITGMVEGKEKENRELIQRLHAVIRPFLLRRLKRDVAQQLPPKFEHVVMCRLSRRQRQLYDEFMSRGSTLETLTGGNYLGLMNVLMQLRKVCNHPDLFAGRPIVSPLDMDQLFVTMSSAASRALMYDPLRHLSRTLMQVVAQAHAMSSWEPELVRSRLLSRDRLSQLFDERAEALVAKALPLGDHSSHGISQIREHHRALAVRYALLNEQRSITGPLIGNDAVRRCVIPHPVLHVHSLAESGITREDVSLSVLDLVVLPERRAAETLPLVDNFTCFIPRARVRRVKVYCSHPDPSQEVNQQQHEMAIANTFSSLTNDVHHAYVRTQLNFPDRRLLQFDCGKLQSLDKLLRELKARESRALIFTQMSKMLDILEAFLNIYGYTYLRLDGATKVDERQKLMEKFNSDKRIFVFILSTRSGGVGINLTGADTVIFYDTDWNPAMDQQAQDRCHRIGQTKDVHIYRLVCSNTVEENILRKANQKRHLNALAIHDGNFTTDTLMSMDADELFGMPVSKVAVGSKGASESIRSMASIKAMLGAPTEFVSKELERALEAVEDESDRTAADRLRSELKEDAADFAEGTANPIGGGEPQVVDDVESINQALTPIQRYALHFIEEVQPAVNAEELAALEAQIAALDARERKIYAEAVEDTAKADGEAKRGKQNQKNGQGGHNDEGSLFYVVEGNPAADPTEGYRARLTHYEQQGMAVFSKEPVGLRAPPEDGDDVYVNPIYVRMEQEDWGIFSTPEQWDRLLRKPKTAAARRQRLMQRRLEKLAKASQAKPNVSLTVRIPRSKLPRGFKRHFRSGMDEPLSKRPKLPGGGVIGGPRRDGSTAGAMEMDGRPGKQQMPRAGMSKQQQPQLQQQRGVGVGMGRGPAAAGGMHPPAAGMGGVGVGQMGLPGVQRRPEAAREPLPWTDDEDAALLLAVEEHGPHWYLVADVLNSDARFAGRMRTAQECVERHAVAQAKKPPDLPSQQAIPQAQQPQPQQGAGLAPSRKKKDDDSVPGFGSAHIYMFLMKAMKTINQQRQSCKQAMRASTLSIAGPDDASNKALMAMAHSSHKKAVADAQLRLNTPQEKLNTVLMPEMIVELRNRKAQPHGEQDKNAARRMSQQRSDSPTRGAEPFLVNKQFPTQSRLTTSQVMPSNISPYAVLANQGQMPAGVGPVGGVPPAMQPGPHAMSQHGLPMGGAHSHHGMARGGPGPMPLAGPGSMSGVAGVPPMAPPHHMVPQPQQALQPAQPQPQPQPQPLQQQPPAAASPKQTKKEIKAAAAAAQKATKASTKGKNTGKGPKGKGTNSATPAPAAAAPAQQRVAAPPASSPPYPQPVADVAQPGKGKKTSGKGASSTPATSVAPSPPLEPMATRGSRAAAAAAAGRGSRATRGSMEVDSPVTLPQSPAPHVLPQPIAASGKGKPGPSAAAANASGKGSKRRVDAMEVDEPAAPSAPIASNASAAARHVVPPATPTVPAPVATTPAGPAAAANAIPSLADTPTLRHVITTRPQLKNRLFEVLQRKDWTQEQKVEFLAKLFKQQPGTDGPAAPPNGRPS